VFHKSNTEPYPSINQFWFRKFLDKLAQRTRELAEAPSEELFIYCRTSGLKTSASISTSDFEPRLVSGTPAYTKTGYVVLTVAKFYPSDFWYISRRELKLLCIVLNVHFADIFNAVSNNELVGHTPVGYFQTLTVPHT